jgi:HK97 family phage prohead protease
MSAPTSSEFAEQTRTASVRFTEIRADGGLRLAGVAAVYGQDSEDMGFIEQIERGAFAQTLQNDDPLLVWSHDQAQPLARASAGNLRLRETSQGLEFEADLPDTTLARDAVKLVKSGVIKAMSFGFSMHGGKDRWEQHAGQSRRFIERVGRLFEISLVASPAYGSTLVEARAGSRGPLRVRERSAYGPGSNFSWFRDLATVSLAQGQQNKRAELELEYGRLGPGDGTSPIGSRSEQGDQGGVDEARARLNTVETRDITTADPGAGVFVPASGSVPTFVADAFAAAARAQATLAVTLPRRELPASGLTVTAPGLSTGASVATQAPEAATVSETDIDTTPQASQVALVQGQQDMSIQALERSAPGLDVVLAADLGRALAAELDSQLATGTNANQQLLGLAHVIGRNAISYTDASPTAQELIAKLWTAYAAVATPPAGWGTSDPGLYATVVHPRRFGFLFSSPQNAQTIRPQVPGSLVACGGVRSTIATTQDECFVLVPDALPYFTDAPRFAVMDDVLSGTLEVRFQARQYAASGFGRAPTAIAHVTGTGLVAP